MKKVEIIKRNKIYVVIVFYVLLDVLSRLPYLNVYLRPWIIFPMLWACVVVLYGIKYRYTFGVIAVLLLLSSLAIILDRQGIADEIGNCIFLLFIVGVTQFLFASYKKY